METRNKSPTVEQWLRNQKHLERRRQNRGMCGEEMAKSLRRLF